MKQKHNIFAGVLALFCVAACIVALIKSSNYVAQKGPAITQQSQRQKIASLTAADTSTRTDKTTQTVQAATDNKQSGTAAPLANTGSTSTVTIFVAATIIGTILAHMVLRRRSE